MSKIIHSTPPAAGATAGAGAGITPDDDMPQCDPLKIVICDPRTLVIMLASPEVNVCGQACEALVSYADQGPKQKAEVLKLNAIPAIKKLLVAKAPQLHRSAALFMSSLTESADVRKEVRRCKVIEPLVALLDPEEESEVHENVSQALANLAEDYASKADILSLGALGRLVPLLCATDPDVLKNVSGTICLLLEDYNCRELIRDVGGIQPLIDLMGSEYSDIQENALISLGRCSVDSKNREQIRELGGIRKMIEFLAPSFEEAHSLVLHTLSCCLDDDISIALFEAEGGLQALINLLMQSSDVQVKVNAALSIARAAKNATSRDVLREAGGVDSLITLINDPDQPVEVAAHVALALAILAESRQNSSIIAEQDGLSSLVTLLNNDSLIVQENASLALATCSNKSEARIVISKLDCIIPLAALLSQDHPNIQVNAATCLCNLSKDVELRPAVRGAGTIAKLCAVLSSKSQHVQSKAALALAELMQDPEGRSELRILEGGLSSLVSLARDGAESVRRNAAWAMSAMAADIESADALCGAGGLDVLCALSNAPNKMTAQCAEVALSRVLNHNLSAKYWLQDAIAPSNYIQDGFYDMGRARSGAVFLSLDVLRKAPVAKGRATLTVNVAEDVALVELVERCTKDIKPLESTVEQVIALANLVATQMGGPISVNELSQFSFELPISQLKFDIKSNVIPLGSITTGIFYHRALLFKTLADRIGFPCSLRRADYNRAANSILVVPSGGGIPEENLVDLMFEPGRLMPVLSAAAINYMKF